MRVITLNVNGLRSAGAKGFMPWMRRQRPDVVCLQEIKCQEADLTKALLAPRAKKLAGAIAGRALYDGRLDPAAALALIRSARAAA